MGCPYDRRFVRVSRLENPMRMSVGGLRDSGGRAGDSGAAREVLQIRQNPPSPSHPHSFGLMLDDLLAELFGRAISRRLPDSERAQLVVRVFFGLLVTVLAVVGAVHFAGRTELRTNGPMWLSMIGVFVFWACFCLFNVSLGRKWPWPGVLLIASFVALFVARIAFGA